MENGNINPWLHLWVKPRQTIRSLIDTNPKKWILWLAIIGGILTSIAIAAHSWYAAKIPLLTFLLFFLFVIAGVIMGLIQLYFSSWLLTLTGSWIGGKGNFTDVKCAVGWSNYPYIIANIFAILFAIFSQHVWVAALLGLVNIILAFWAFIISLKLVGEAHRFSAWKALLAFAIAIVLVLVVLMIIALLIPLLTPLFK